MRSPINAVSRTRQNRTAHQFGTDAERIGPSGWSADQEGVRVTRCPSTLPPYERLLSRSVLHHPTPCTARQCLLLPVRAPWNGRPSPIRATARQATKVIPISAKRHHPFGLIGKWAHTPCGVRRVAGVLERGPYAGQTRGWRVPTKARSAAASCFTAQLSLAYDTSEVLSDEDQPERGPSR